MLKLGVDIGSSTIKAVLLKDDQIKQTDLRAHAGRIIPTLLQMLYQMKQGMETEHLSVMLTGHGARQLAALDTRLQVIEDIPAIKEGIVLLAPQARAVIEVGCQNARFLTGLAEGVPLFAMNDHCAGGTGSFFEAQMSRLGLTMADYSELVGQARSIPNMSGRCAVFAKSDMIHRQQEQVPTADILLGLCYAMARNFKAVIMGRLPLDKPVAFCGGVAENKGVRQAFQDILSLSDDELIIPKHYRFVGAAGAARKAEQTMNWEDILSILETHRLKLEVLPRLPRLALETQAVMGGEQWPELLPQEGCYLGIDIGSTSTNLVLVDQAKRLLGYQYFMTAGDPVSAVQRGLAELWRKYGQTLPILAIGITGSGRQRIGEMLKAEVIRDEITAQARAAVYAAPEADTVFEIGGQDSKYIALKNGQVVDFQMNKICAAGTGAFIEEQAVKLNIPLADFGPLAMTADEPVDLGERCTVFMEAAIATAIIQGAVPAEIAAGLCHAIVQNYLHKVVGTRQVGQHIVLQGGVAYNPGIVSAFRSYYGERLQVSPVFAVSGAFGVALLAAENGQARRDFRPVTLNCFTEASTQQAPVVTDNNRPLLKDYDPIGKPGRKTVGVPYALMIHKFFPMANAFFTELGFNVRLSSLSNEQIIAKAQQSASSETCYPVKLIYGHMQELAEAQVDYIFMPSIRTMKHETSKVAHNYGCVYMQSAPQLIYADLNLQDQGIGLLNPVFDIDFGKKAMAESMVALGETLGFSKPSCMKALLAGAMAVRNHTALMEKQGQQLLEGLTENEKILVIITRNYGIDDPVLNMGIPQLLQERGCKVLTLSQLPAHDLDLSADHPDLCWPFGQHILSGAKLIRHHPNLFAVYLTNHGCGPDTMLSHLFREEMGDKPYLQIEVDEHFSKIGVITRIEAFLNSLAQQPTQTVSSCFNWRQTAIQPIHLSSVMKPERMVAIPDLPPYGRLLAAYYEAKCIPTRLLPLGAAEMTRGLEETVSKEYSAFTLLAGGALKAVEIDAKMQILLPHTEGAEADNQYSRVIDALLRLRGFEQTWIYSPCIECLPQESTDLPGIFRLLLLGDLYYAFPVDMRSRECFDQPRDWSDVLRQAEKLRTIKQPTGRRLAVVGDPICLFVLAKPIFEQLEQEGYYLHRMPLAEYMLYLWQQDSKNSSKLLDACREEMRQLSEALGDWSPFADDFKYLTPGDQQMGRFVGGNGSYRLAKIRQESQKVDGILSAAAQYENTELILTMNEQLIGLPLYHMELGNRWENSDWERLRSFLYYL